MDNKRLVIGMVLAMAVVMGWQAFVGYMYKKNPQWKQNQQTAQRLEKLANAKGWRLPQANPGREGSQLSPADGHVGEARANANFIVNQITVHQVTLAQYQAQIAGKGDAELKRVLRDSLPGYRANLEMLLTLKP